MFFFNVDNFKKKITYRFYDTGYMIACYKLERLYIVYYELNLMD